jgi:hypothetical protein
LESHLYKGLICKQTVPLRKLNNDLKSNESLALGPQLGLQVSKLNVMAEPRTVSLVSLMGEEKVVLRPTRYGVQLAGRYES